MQAAQWQDGVGGGGAGFRPSTVSILPTIFDRSTAMRVASGGTTAQIFILSGVTEAVN